MDWQPEFETGHRGIDAQHRYFLSLILEAERLLRFESLAGPPTQVPLLLKEITLYARFHFAYEDELMSRYSDPNAPLHRREHEQLLAELGLLEEHVLSGMEDTATLLLFLFNWFAGHTTVIDRDLADHVRYQEGLEALNP